MTHPESAPPALQLAAAFLWADRRPWGHDFVCLDARLREAARAEGFRVLPGGRRPLDAGEPLGKLVLVP